MTSCGAPGFPPARPSQPKELPKISQPRTYHLVSLGCPKNLVDSEGMAALLHRSGFEHAETADDADLLIVNTCGFIDPAREESIGLLRELASSKRPGQYLVAAGCFAQRSPEEIAEVVPGVDGLIGTRRWMDILPLVEGLDRRQASGQLDRGPLTYQAASGVSTEADLPRVAVQGASAYLKLADGCHRSCAFCAIPLIKGPTASRHPEAILADAGWLAERDVQEISLIAQDTTSYGRDLGMRNGLADLLDKLVEAVPDVPWIRVMYAFPGPELVALAEAMARHDQVLPYLDIPLQHAHPDVLRRMRRPSDVSKLRTSIEHVRGLVPNIAIRTTFIVGFPGETGAEFRSLLRFVDEMAFDRVGAFAYSHEAGTPASEFDDDVSPELKEERRERLMAIQQPLSLAKNEALVGQTLDVLVEGQGDGISIGRSFRDAPEIDGLVLVQDELPVGQILPVHITTALEYDLVAVPLAKASLL